VRKVWAVIRREFVERVRRKWFWVMALLGPVFFGAIIFLPTLMLRGGGVKNIAVVDGTTQGLGERVTVLLDRAVTPDSHPVFRAVRVPAHDHVIDSLTAEVEAKRLEGFLILTDALVDSGRAEYQASNVSSFTAIETIERNLTQLVLPPDWSGRALTRCSSRRRGCLLRLAPRRSPVAGRPKRAPRNPSPSPTSWRSSCTRRSSSTAST
jgi:ABC-type Na+ efflux pump permease subunit